MKQFLSITSILLLFHVFSYAQQGNTLLKGKVIDQETNEGIAFVSIGIEGTFLGTATNPDGNFELKVPEEQLSKSLYFSAIGYKNISFPISELIQKQDLTIKLIPQSYNIQEIDVAAESKVLQRILRTASENISSNYISVPMNMKMYYVEQKSTGITAGKTAKTIVNLYDAKGYSIPSWSDAFKSRSYEITEAQSDFTANTFRVAANSLDELLESDPARLSNIVLNPNLLNDFKLTMEEKTRFNNDSVWIISYEALKLDLAHTGSYYPTSFRGKIYISQSNYAVLRNEINLTEGKSNQQGRSLAAKSNPITKIQRNITTGYKKVKNKYVLAYIDSEKQYTSNDKESVYESGKIVILNIETQNTKPVKGREYFTEIKPNKIFWQNFVAPSY